MQGNYEKILDKISQASGLTISDLEAKIDAKREKLSGLISKEGAAQVVAAELGISFEDEPLKINELLPGMRKVKVIGKIVSCSPIRTFQTKSGVESKVMNLMLADDTSNVKVVLWDTNHIALFEKSELGEGSVVDIGNGSMRDHELHLGSFSEIKPSNETFKEGELKTEKIVHEKQISELKNGENAGVRAFIVQAFEPKFFYVCPQCKKKANQESEDNFTCAEHGRVDAEKKAIVNLVVDDGSESIRAVFFHDKIPGLGIDTAAENLVAEKDKLLGKEMLFSGNVRNNSYFNNIEFIVDHAKEINLDSVIAELEKN